MMQKRIRHTLVGGLIDSLIREWGHKVIWPPPPGRPGLIAVEQVWGVMKRHVRFSPRRFNRADIQARMVGTRRRATSRV